MSAVPQTRPSNSRSLFIAAALVVVVGFQLALRRDVERWTAAGFEVEVFADASSASQPAAICVDRQDRLFVVEAQSFVMHDLTGFEEQLAARTWSDAEQLAATEAVTWRGSDRVRILEDLNDDGRADRATTVAEGFPLQDGVASGIAVRNETVWLANAPNLWRLENADHDGRFTKRQALQHGFGVRRMFRGHGLHGLIFGPDGKLYIAMGDRGLHVKTDATNELSVMESGCVLRCNPDGSELEVFATGLRNPYDLAFDKYGNLWTADNDSNWGERSRWIYVVEGGDSGWQVGYQPLPHAGRFNSERIWDADCDVPFRVPPAGCVGRGPAGLAYYPGTGLPNRFNDRFFLCDYTGKIFSLAVEPAGAGYRLGAVEQLLHVPAPTDIAFGNDGVFYVADWMVENVLDGQGRILRVRHPEASKDPIVEQVKSLLAEGMSHRTSDELAALLEHQDQRVRQEAQFEFAARGASEIETLSEVLTNSRSQLARIHAIWALGQISVSESMALHALIKLLRDDDPEIRAQAANVLGERRHEPAYGELIARLEDANPRVQYFAAFALGKLGRSEAGPAIIAMLRASAGDDEFLRHAAMMALTVLGDVELLHTASTDDSREVRLAALLAMRRLKRHEIVSFLNDSDPLVVLAAARAIHDVPIASCLPELAALIHRNELAEPVLARAINAQYRLGTTASAKTLVEFARRNDVSTSARVAALHALAEWSSYDGRDRVLGLWRPLPTRSSGSAREALQSHFPEFLKDPAAEVILAANSAAAALGIKATSESLRQRVHEPTLPSQLRADALQMLVERRARRVSQLVDYALRSDDETLRLTAVKSLPLVEPPDTATTLLSIALSDEPLSIRQAAVSALGNSTSRCSELVILELVEHAIGHESPTIHLELVEAVEKRGAPESRDRLKSLAFQHADEALGDHWVSLQGGDARAGRDIFFRNAAAQCARCHRLGPREETAGPSLARAGRHSRRKLLESIIRPNAVIADGYGQTTLQLNDGTMATGIIEAEDGFQIRLRLLNGRPQEIQHDQIEQRTPPQSGMPADFSSKLTKREIRDLIAFLTGLGDFTKEGQNHDEL